MNETATALNDRQTSRRRHLLGFGAVAGLALLLIAMTLNAFFARQARERADQWEMHTMEVLLTAEQARSAANMALRGERGYIITRDQSFLEPYRRGAEQAPRAARALRMLTQDNPRQIGATAALERDLRTYLTLVGRTIEHVRANRIAEAIAIVRRSEDRRHIERVLARLDGIAAEERRLLAEREARNARATSWTELADLGFVGLALLLLGVVGWAGVTASRARLETLQLEAKLREAATMDELTGLLNRRAFLHALDTEIARSARNGAPLSIALIDLDHFKKVNDSFGHQGGDDVLRRFADVTRQVVRAADVVGRLGGEEFAVLMPDTDRVQGGIAGERLREAIARRHFVTTAGALAPTTISVGVAHHRPGETREGLISRADEALYDAKHQGRNRTRLAA